MLSGDGEKTKYGLHDLIKVERGEVNTGVRKGKGKKVGWELEIHRAEVDYLMNLCLLTSDVYTASFTTVEDSETRLREMQKLPGWGDQLWEFGGFYRKYTG